MKKDYLFILIAFVMTLVGGYYMWADNALMIFDRAMDTAVELDQTETLNPELTGFTVDELNIMMFELLWTGDIDMWPVAEEREWNMLELKDNKSSNAYRRATGASYMQALNATDVKFNELTTEATLWFTIDIEGEQLNQNRETTFNITIWYVDCKYDVAFNNKNIAYWDWIIYWNLWFPQHLTVDLADLRCADRKQYNKKYDYNAILDLIEGKRLAIFFAKEQGIVKDAVIHYR